MRCPSEVVSTFLFEILSSQLIGKNDKNLIQVAFNTIRYKIIYSMDISNPKCWVCTRPIAIPNIGSPIKKGGQIIASKQNTFSSGGGGEGKVL